MTWEVYFVDDLDMDTVELDFTCKWEDVKKQINSLKRKKGFPKNWEELPVYEFLTVDETYYEDDIEEEVWEKYVNNIYDNPNNEKTLREVYDDYTDWYIMDDLDKKKINAYVKNGESYEWCRDNLDDLYVYEFSGCADAEETLEKLAMLMVEEGMYGEVSDRLKFYIDYELLGKDLGVDYSVVEPGVAIRLI